MPSPRRSRTRSCSALRKNLDGKLLSGSGEIVSSVASGESLAGITLEETALKRIAAGDEIEMIYPTDGTSCVPDGTAIVSGAPHPDNAKAFVDFTVSRDVQELIQERFYRRSVRAMWSLPVSFRRSSS